MSKISHHKLAIAKGAQPFDLDSERPSLSTDTNGEDSEDIYTNLQQVGNYRDHFIELDDKRTWDNSGVYQNQNRVNEVKLQNDSKKRRPASASTSTASSNSNSSNLSSLHDSLFDSNMGTNFSNTETCSVASPQHTEPVAYEPIYAYVEEDPYGDESLYAALMEIRKKVDLPPNGELFRFVTNEIFNFSLPE